MLNILVTLHNTFSSCLNIQQVTAQYYNMKTVNGNISIRMAIPWTNPKKINPVVFQSPGKII